MKSPTPGFGWQTSTTRVDRAVFDEGLRRHMLSIYNYMAIGLVVTGVVAYLVGTTPALYVPIFTTPLKWVVMLAPLAFVLFFSFRIERDVGEHRAADVLGVLRGHGPVARVDLPRLHGNEHRADLLRRRRHVRRHEPLRLHDEARPHRSSAPS